MKKVIILRKIQVTMKIFAPAFNHFSLILYGKKRVVMRAMREKLLKLKMFMLQLPIYYILEKEISTEMRTMNKKPNIFMRQLPIYYILN